VGLLVTGVCLWALVHLIPCIAPGFKQAWKARLGEGGYMGSFALLILLSLLAIIFGWRSAQPVLLYLPPDIFRMLSMPLMVVAFLLFTSSKRPTRLRRWLRHPQLSGMLVWAATHLLVNGDSRSLVLFGGLGLWSVVEMAMINRREGAWQKPPAPGWGAEVTGLVISLAMVAVVVWAHPWLAGVPVH
jgi:uncharacterized membrane protein